MMLDVEQTLASTLSPESMTAFLREVSAAMKKLAMYPPSHPASIKAAEKPFTILDDLLKREKTVVFAVADGRVVGNGTPLEEKLTGEGLGKVLHESSLASIAFDPGLVFSEFEKFLSFLSVKREQRDLQGFLEAEKIKGISVGKLQYQLVSDEEKVVPAEIAESLGDGSLAELKMTLAQALRKRPELLLRLLGRQNHAGSAPAVTPPVATTQTLAAGAVAGTEAVEGEQKEICGELRFDPSDHTLVLSTISVFNDDDLLSLLTAALRQSLGEGGEVRKIGICRTLFNLKELLAEKGALDLLPRLEQELAALNVIDAEHLKLILAPDSSPKEVAYAEVENFQRDFSHGQASLQRADDLYGWLEATGDRKYIDETFRKLYASMEKQEFALTATQAESIDRLATVAAKHLDSDVSLSLMRETGERLANPDVSLNEFRVLTDQLEPFYLSFIESGRYGDAVSLLLLIRQRIDPEASRVEGMPECATGIFKRLTAGEVAETLMRNLERNFDSVCKPMTPLLENFCGAEAIAVFAGRLSSPNRGIRLLLIRLLSGFREEAVKAFKSVLSEKNLTARPAGQTELPLESWHKLRNIILILGNIPHPDSLALVAPFAEDADERVVIEAFDALEKLGGPEAARIVAGLLSHASKAIRTKAMHAVVQIGSEPEYPLLQEYFLRHVEERPLSLPALIKLDRERSLKFLTSVLMGESETSNKPDSKPDEALNEMIVSTFIQMRSVVFDDVLRRYVKNNTSSLLGQLRKPRSVKIAEKYLRTATDA